MMIIRSATPLDAPEIGRIQVTTWQSAYAGIISYEYLNGLSIEKSSKRWESGILEGGDDKFLFLLENEGLARGFVSGGPIRSHLNGFKGEVYALYIEQASQKMGYGQSLLNKAIANLMSLGMPGVAVWVLAKNPSLQFYQKMGGKIIGEQTIKIGDENHVEIGLGWQ